MKLILPEQIDPREYWEFEDKNFTPWLADNIKVLSDKIDIDLEVEDQECSVGPFRADILCKDVANDNYVLIENQLEKTDHTHLGQLMTYAAGLDAVTIVWIARKFTEEHRAAIDWFNSITDDDFNFFGLEIALYKINAEYSAPMLNLIAKPNDWTKQVRHSSNITFDELTPAKKLQLKFWTDFKHYMDGTSSIRMQKPSAQHWNNCAMGRSGFHLSATVNTESNHVSVCLVITEKSNEMFDKLYELYVNAANEINKDLIWEKKEEKKSSVIILHHETDVKDESLRQEQFEWLKATLESFDKFFRPIIKTL